MSADNGIYILKTKDQYRVAHLQAIENISWSHIEGDWGRNAGSRGRYVPTRVVEMWGDSNFTKDGNRAMGIAHRWYSSLPICEYGVNIITYNKTWEQILRDAESYAKKEITYILEQNRQLPCDTEKLQKMADGEYLSDWLSRRPHPKKRKERIKSLRDIS